MEDKVHTLDAHESVSRQDENTQIHASRLDHMEDLVRTLCQHGKLLET